MVIFLFVLAYIVLGVICEYTLYRIDRKVFPDLFNKEHTHISLHEVLFGFYNKDTFKYTHFEANAYTVPWIACRVLTIPGFIFCLGAMLVQCNEDGKLKPAMDKLKAIKVRIK